MFVLLFRFFQHYQPITRIYLHIFQLINPVLHDVLSSWCAVLNLTSSIPCSTSTVLRNNTNQHVSGLFRGQMIGVAHDHHEYVLLVTSDQLCFSRCIHPAAAFRYPTYHSCYCYDAGCEYYKSKSRRSG